LPDEEQLQKIRWRDIAGFGLFGKCVHRWFLLGPRLKARWRSPRRAKEPSQYLGTNGISRTLVLQKPLPRFAPRTIGQTLTHPDHLRCVPSTASRGRHIARIAATTAAGSVANSSRIGRNRSARSVAAARNLRVLSIRTPPGRISLLTGHSRPNQPLEPNQQPVENEDQSSLRRFPKVKIARRYWAAIWNSLCRRHAGSITAGSGQVESSQCRGTARPGRS
jgi:hypothetical protein